MERCFHRSSPAVSDTVSYHEEQVTGERGKDHVRCCESMRFSRSTLRRDRSPSPGETPPSLRDHLRSRGEGYPLPPRPSPVSRRDPTFPSRPSPASRQRARSPPTTLSRLPARPYPAFKPPPYSPL